MAWRPVRIGGKKERSKEKPVRFIRSVAKFESESIIRLLPSLKMKKASGKYCFDYWNHIVASYPLNYEPERDEANDITVEKVYWGTQMKFGQQSLALAETIA